MEENISFKTGKTDGERAFLYVDTFEDAVGSGLFQPFLRVADKDSLPLAGGGLYIVIAGFRIACILAAGKDEGGR